MAPHSSTLAWKLPWMEKPGRLQSMGPTALKGLFWAEKLIGKSAMVGPRGAPCLVISK